MANRFYVQPAQYGPALQGFSDFLGEYGDRQMVIDEMERQRAEQAELRGLRERLFDVNQPEEMPMDQMPEQEM